MKYQIFWAVFLPRYGSNRVPFVVYPGASVQENLEEFCAAFGWSIDAVAEVIEGEEIGGEDGQPDAA